MEMPVFVFSCPAWTRTRDYSINSRVFYQLNYRTKYASDRQLLRSEYHELLLYAVQNFNSTSVSTRSH